MTVEEAIAIIETAKAEVEWSHPLEYAVAFEMAIAALHALAETEQRQTQNRSAAKEGVHK